MKLLAALFFSSCLFAANAQVCYQAELRFCGVEQCRSVIAEVNSPYFETWNRFESLPSAITNSEEFPASSSAFGYTSVAGFGIPQAKLVLGIQNGEFVKGIHLYGEDGDATFRTSVILLHKPSVPNDAFRMDGELSIEKFAYPFNTSSKNRSRRAEYSMGGALRFECYEPSPMSFQAGFVLRRTQEQKSVGKNRQKPGGDFLDSFEPQFLNMFEGTSYSTDWSLSVGPTLYFDHSYGLNASLRCLF